MHYKLRKIQYKERKKREFVQIHSYLCEYAHSFFFTSRIHHIQSCFLHTKSFHLAITSSIFLAFFFALEKKKIIPLHIGFDQLWESLARFLLMIFFQSLHLIHHPPWFRERQKFFKNSFERCQRRQPCVKMQNPCFLYIYTMVKGEMLHHVKATWQSITRKIFTRGFMGLVDCTRVWW